MLPWGSQQIPICESCHAKLDWTETQAPWCAFNEVHPRELQPHVPPAGVLVETRLLPAVESPVPRRSMAGRCLGALGQMFRPGSRRRDVGRALGLRGTTKEG